MYITQRLLLSVNNPKDRHEGVQVRRRIARAVERGVDIVVVKQPSRVVKGRNAVDAFSKMMSSPEACRLKIKATIGVVTATKK